MYENMSEFIAFWAMMFIILLTFIGFGIGVCKVSASDEAKTTKGVIVFVDENGEKIDP